MNYLIKVNVSYEIESSDRVFSTERLVKDITYIEALNPQMLWGLQAWWQADKVKSFLREDAPSIFRTSG